MRILTIILASLICLSLSSQSNGSRDIIRYDSRGLPHKVGEIKQGRNGEIDVYKMNKNNLMERTKTIVPNRGNLDVYDIRSNGLPYLEQTIKSTTPSSNSLFGTPPPSIFDR